MFLATSIIFAKDIIDGLAFIDNTLSGSNSYDVSPGSVKWEIIHTILVRFNVSGSSFFLLFAVASDML